MLKLADDMKQSTRNALLILKIISNKKILTVFVLNKPGMSIPHGFNKLITIE